MLLNVGSPRADTSGEENVVAGAARSPSFSLSLSLPLSVTETIRPHLDIE